MTKPDPIPEQSFNLLFEPVIRTIPSGALTLPSLLAALSSDRIDSFPALRPHQIPLWHMFLVQLAALALHAAGRIDLAQTEEEWIGLLRALTPEHPDDAPWRLVVSDWTKPAFLQPPVPADMNLPDGPSTPDGLDMLITARNHDVKWEICSHSEPDDWIFALVARQTGEGYGGSGYYGISRMNGGSSSRPFLGLAPTTDGSGKGATVRPGAHFRRDVLVLLEDRADPSDCDDIRPPFPETGGIGLTWIEDWPEDHQIPLLSLDRWFIESCQRIRLAHDGEKISSRKGSSKSERIDAKTFKGVLGDPWALVLRSEAKILTFTANGFSYPKMVDYLFSNEQEWVLPLLARPSRKETEEGRTMLVVAAGIARGNCTTNGTSRREIPIGGRILRRIGTRSGRSDLHSVAKTMLKEAEVFDAAIRDALVLAAFGGDVDGLAATNKTGSRMGTLRERSKKARDRFDRCVDALFFEQLWVRFEAQDLGLGAVDAIRLGFLGILHREARGCFESELPSIPCHAVRRLRAETRARSRFIGVVRKGFPELFSTIPNEVDPNAAP